MKKAVSAVILTIMLVATGCTDWERTTFQTLSASKATIDGAQADYEAGVIPKTQPAYAAITEAKKAQTAAVDALVAYESIKAAKGTQSALDAQQAIVAAALGQLAPLIAAIRALIPSTAKAKVDYPFGFDFQAHTVLVGGSL